MLKTGIGAGKRQYRCPGILRAMLIRETTDIQIKDFCYFLRKAMEKNQWKQKTGQKILEAYEEVRPLSEREKEFAALSLAYPGKFKKIAGSYYRSNKAHLSEKNVEKLQICIRQTEEKYEFLSRIFPLNL